MRLFPYPVSDDLLLLKKLGIERHRVSMAVLAAEMGITKKTLRSKIRKMNRRFESEQPGLKIMEATEVFLVGSIQKVREVMACLLFERLETKLLFLLLCGYDLRRYRKLHPEAAFSRALRVVKKFLAPYGLIYTVHGLVGDERVIRWHLFRFIWWTDQLSLVETFCSEKVREVLVKNKYYQRLGPIQQRQWLLLHLLCLVRPAEVKSNVSQEVERFFQYFKKDEYGVFCCYTIGEGELRYLFSFLWTLPLFRQQFPAYIPMSDEDLDCFQEECQLFAGFPLLENQIEGPLTRLSEHERITHFSGQKMRQLLIEDYLVLEVAAGTATDAQQVDWFLRTQLKELCSSEETIIPLKIQITTLPELVTSKRLYMPLPISESQRDYLKEELANYLGSFKNL